jgi:hypothetical protein
MAKRTNFDLVLGTDRDLHVTVYAATGDTIESVSGWTFSFMIKSDLEDLDNEALLTITSISTTGTYNSDPDVNTEVVVVSIADTDTESLTPQTASWELKRTNAGYEDRIAYGSIKLIRGVHR